MSVPARSHEMTDPGVKVRKTQEAGPRSEGTVFGLASSRWGMFTSRTRSVVLPNHY